MHNKGNCKESENIRFRMGANICQRHDQQGVNLQNIQSAPLTQHKKTNNPIKTMGRRSKKTFSKDIQGAKKTLNIANYRNANQNYSEVPSHTSQNGQHQKVCKQ